MIEVLIRQNRVGWQFGHHNDLQVVLTSLETIRCQGAVILGLALTPEEACETSQDVPKIAFVSEPRNYGTITGRSIKQEETDLVARIMSMGTLHKAYAVTGAICTAGAAKIQGTVVYEMLREESHGTDEVRLGHPGGIISVGTTMGKNGDTYHYREAIVDRTARRLMDGYVYVPERHFSKIEGENG